MAWSSLCPSVSFFGSLSSCWLIFRILFLPCPQYIVSPAMSNFLSFSLTRLGSFRVTFEFDSATSTMQWVRFSSLYVNAHAIGPRISAICFSLARHMSLFLFIPFPILCALLLLGWSLCQVTFITLPILYFFPGDPPPLLYSNKQALLLPECQHSCPQIYWSDRCGLGVPLPF